MTYFIPAVCDLAYCKIVLYFPYLFTKPTTTMNPNTTKITSKPGIFSLNSVADAVVIVDIAAGDCVETEVCCGVDVVEDVDEVSGIAV